jgi:hypothetical protein
MATKKRPQYVVDMVQANREYQEHWGWILIRKREDNPSLAPSYKDMTEGEIIGRITGANMMLEKLLHATGTYAGFNYMRLDGKSFEDKEFTLPRDQRPWEKDPAIGAMRNYF